MSIPAAAGTSELTVSSTWPVGTANEIERVASVADVTIPRSDPRLSTNAPPLTPGSTAAVVWISPFTGVPRNVLVERSTALTIPLVTTYPAIGGRPTARTNWPGRCGVDDGAMGVRSLASTRNIARSVDLLRLITAASTPSPAGVVTRIRSAHSTTCAAVTIRPLDEAMTPEPTLPTRLRVSNPGACVGPGRSILIATTDSATADATRSMASEMAES